MDMTVIFGMLLASLAPQLIPILQRIIDWLSGFGA